MLCSALMVLLGRRGRSVSPVVWRLVRPMVSGALAIVIASAAVGCGDVNAALERLSEARRLSADLYVQFVKAADAGNRAVMADTDEASVVFAHEAEQATQAAQADVAALKPILQTLHYSNESRLLEEFDGRFEKYRALDRTILDLAVENTNLKAQRLSFGVGQEAAEAFRRSLEAVEPLATSDEWRLKALIASAVASVREIQVLQAPHIAEPDDAAMARIEQQMTAEEAAARSALTKLGGITRPASQARLAAATAALDRFAGINREILGLSRRNTNVRSLALSMDEKRPLTTTCEESLRALQDTLAKRGFPTKR
jgi:hypothetical protein